MREDVVRRCADLRLVTCAEAYRRYRECLDVPAREWIYLVNLALVLPYHRYGNTLLCRRRLKIGVRRGLQLRMQAVRSMKRVSRFNRLSAFLGFCVKRPR